MANRYNAWAPTRAVPLPIDYYQSALMLKDQRTAESLDKINAIISAYGQIQPVSPDAQALYDQTTEELRNRVMEVSKEKLDTPEAQRRVNQIIQDPAIAGNMEKVYMDAVYAAEARKNLNEYLKKNPNVNAVDYLVAFNKLGTETGDPTKFNPNRFKNMPALSDYFDVNKLVAEEVSKLKANEEEVKRIMGNKYVTYKKAGVLEDRIRDLAVSRVMTDPQASAQFQRNNRYTHYLQNPVDPDAGLTETAQFYRNNIKERTEQMKNKWAEITAGKTPAQIAADKDIQKAKMVMDRTLFDYQQLDQLDDEALSRKVAMDAFSQSFDSYANRQTKYEEEWTPVYLQQLRDAAANSRLWTRLQFNKSMIEDAFSAKPVTVPDTRQQDPISPGSWGEYIKRIPGLSNVRLDQNGAFTADAYGKKDFARVRLYDGKSDYQGEAYYNRNDIVTVPKGEKPPAGYVRVGLTGGGGENSSSPGPLQDVYVLPNTTSYKSIPKDKGAQFEQGKDQLRQYLRQIIPSGDLSRYNDLKDETGVKTAIQDVVAFNQAFESTYGTNYQLPASNTNSFRASVADLISKTGVRKANGKQIDPGKTAAIQEALRKSNSNITPTFKFYDRNWDTPVYSFTVDGETYTAPMHQEYQAWLGPAQNILSRIVKGDAGPLAHGNSLIVTGLENGQQINAVFQGANTPQYQQQAKVLFEENIGELMKAGFSREEATKTLRTTAAQAADFMRNGEAFPIRNEKTNQTAYIKNAVGFYTNPRSRRPTPVYYSFSQIGDNSVKPLGQVLYDEMAEFGSTKNPYMAIPNMDLMRNKTLLGILSNTGGGGDDDFGPDY